MHERDRLVKCPPCDGKGCVYCEQEGVLPVWAAEAITTDGVVR